MIEYQFDDNGQEDPARFSPFMNHKVLSCKEHKHLGHPKNVFEEVLDENRTKNHVLNELQQVRPDLFDEYNQPTSNLRWLFTNKDRDLEILITGVSDSDKGAIRSRVAEFGAFGVHQVHRKVIIK